MKEGPSKEIPAWRPFVFTIGFLIALFGVFAAIYANGPAGGQLGIATVGLVMMAVSAQNAAIRILLLLMAAAALVTSVGNPTF